MKKCIYCGAEIPDESVIDFCHRCGVGVWGEKMFKTILKNMEDARDRGDLCHNQTVQENKEETEDISNDSVKNF